MRDMPSYYEMAIALYKRQQGILWKHRENENMTFNVISKCTHEQPHEQINIVPEYPEFEFDSDYPGSM